jgi:hypothetical protein
LQKIQSQQKLWQSPKAAGSFNSSHRTCSAKKCFTMSFCFYTLLTTPPPTAAESSSGSCLNIFFEALGLDGLKSSSEDMASIGRNKKKTQKNEGFRV